MTEELNTIDTVDTSPFKKLVMTIGELPTSFVDSMTYYELLAWLCNYIENTVIPAVNNNAEALEELQDKFVELKDYVEHYFDNLDVQEEINAKLDQMVDDGELTTLIGQYVQPIQDAYEARVDASIAEQFAAQNTRIENVEAQVSSAVEGTPLPATSTSDMTDTSRIYVNTTDGNWYYYDGDSWEIGGVYESTVLSDGSVDANNLVSNLKTQLQQITISGADITLDTEEVYINIGTSQGYCKFRPNTSFNVYGPFHMYKGDIVSFKASGTATNMTILGLDAGIDTVNNNERIFWNIVSSIDTTLRTYTKVLDYTGDYYITARATYGIEDFKIYHKVKSFNNNDTINIDEYVNNVIVDSSTYPEASYTPNKFVKYADGTLSNSATYSATDYIEIRPNTKIVLRSEVPSWKLGTQTDDTSGYAFYDADKNFISGVQKHYGIQSVELTVPVNAKYIRLTLISTQIINGYKLYYSDLIGELIKIKNSVTTNENLNRTMGITDNAVFIGDSLTNGAYYTASGTRYRNFYNYPYFLKKLMGINSITELAKNGGTAQSLWSQFGSQITATNSVYFVWIGTNSTFTDTIDTDCAGNDYNDYANTETGCMGKILGKINSLEGNKIVLINVFRGGGHPEQTNTMLNKFAQKFDIDLIIDTYNSDIRNVKYHTAYNGYVDDTHLNDKGNNYMANLVNIQLDHYLDSHQFELVKEHSNPN